MRVVIDAQNGAIFEPDASRALDLRKQNVDLVVQVADLRVPAVERAILDFATCVIGHKLAAADTAADEHALAWKRVAELAAAGGGEIGRSPVQRRGEFAGRHARPGDDRLVVTGEESVGVAELVDANGAEIVLEELSGAALVERYRLAGVLADVLQGCRDRWQFAGAALFDVQRPAARQEGRKGCGMIVAVPAV